MTVGEWLAEATRRLTDAGVITARLDVLILLEDALTIERASLLAHTDRELTIADQAQLNTFITQRESHFPLAYIRGKAAFYGRTFHVSPAVLVPRPETEALVTRLLEIAPSLPEQPHIVDVGTGSGCIGLTAKLELPDAAVTLIDVDPSALEVARKNTALHQTQVTTLQSNLLDALNASADVLLANLPYVPVNYPINKAASREPAIALFSGQDGLDAYRLFWKQVGELPHRPAHIIVEALPEQSAELQILAKAAQYKTIVAQGFTYHFTPKSS